MLASDWKLRAGGRVVHPTRACRSAREAGEGTGEKKIPAAERKMLPRPGGVPRVAKAVRPRGANRRVSSGEADGQSCLLGLPGWALVPGGLLAGVR